MYYIFINLLIVLFYIYYIFIDVHVQNFFAITKKFHYVFMSIWDTLSILYY